MTSSLLRLLLFTLSGALLCSCGFDDVLLIVTLSPDAQVAAAGSYLVTVRFPDGRPPRLLEPTGRVFGLRLPRVAGTYGLRVDALQLPERLVTAFGTATHAVAEGDDAGEVTVSLKGWNGLVPGDVMGATWEGVAGTGPDDVWIAGTRSVVHWNGEGFASRDHPAAAVAVGGGQVYLINDQGIVLANNPEAALLPGTFLSMDGDWAIDSDGKMAHRNGQWLSYPVNSTPASPDWPPDAIASAGSQVWAVGRGRPAYAFDSTGTPPMWSSKTDTLQILSVAGRMVDKQGPMVWAGATMGQAYDLIGSPKTPMVPDSTACGMTLYKGAFIGPRGDVWLGGDHGCISHLSPNKSWSTMQACKAGECAQLRALYIDDSGCSLWAVGEQTLWRLSPCHGEPPPLGR